jgi:hypothetical protein
MGSLRKQFYFTMFYSSAVVFAFMNSTIYWFITRQQNSPNPIEPTPPQASGSPGEEGIVWSWGADTTEVFVPGAPCTCNTRWPQAQANHHQVSDLFGEGWFKGFTIFNLYGITSIIMVIEILFFNSIKRPFVSYLPPSVKRH